MFSKAILKRSMAVLLAVLCIVTCIPVMAHAEDMVVNTRPEYLSKSELKQIRKQYRTSNYTTNENGKGKIYLNDVITGKYCIAFLRVRQTGYYRIDINSVGSCHIIVVRIHDNNECELCFTNELHRGYKHSNIRQFLLKNGDYYIFYSASNGNTNAHINIQPNLDTKEFNFEKGNCWECKKKFCNQ